MKVFMSWSGDRSREVANLLHFWIKCVVQASHPWISTSGIDSGSIWFNKINAELQDTTFGIICLTKENKDAPWILFEAGALAKGLASSRVCTLLIDLETKDIRDPLAQFNHTLPNRESLWKLISTLNATLADASRLDVNILSGVFETYWPQFQKKFAEIIKNYPETTVVPPRKEKDILSDILESTRGLERRLRAIENGPIHIDHVIPKNNKEKIIFTRGRIRNPVIPEPAYAEAVGLVQAHLDHGATFDQAIAEARKAFSLTPNGVTEVTNLFFSQRNDGPEI